jgi:RHS repeat-associated protein
VDVPGDVLQENHFYAFGMEMNYNWLNNSGLTDDAYKYNGKEMNGDFGLNWSDYGARWYDASVGRWWSVDPLAEEYFGLNAYHYGINNPVNFNDPSGMSAVPVIDKENKTVTINAQLNFYGKGATSERSQAIANAIQNDWNAANGSVEIDGESYAVRFNVTGKSISKLSAGLGKIFGGAEKNYINLEEGGGNDFSETSIIGGNSGTWLWKQDGISNKEYSHEFGHLLGWYDKNQFKVDEYGTHDYIGYSSKEISGGGNAPGIMTPSNAAQTSKHDRSNFSSLYFEDGRMIRSTRSVTQGDISRIGINSDNPSMPITTKNLIHNPRYKTPTGKSLIKYIYEHAK